MALENIDAVLSGLHLESLRSVIEGLKSRFPGVAVPSYSLGVSQPELVAARKIVHRKGFRETGAGFKFLTSLTAQLRRVGCRVAI